ncbi:acetyl-CoA carboxylase biotin carboxyl carrier protein subunit [Psychroserpens burtonensis]|uniref:Acetyl-CoA carboxylase biotin carboxyl carrier protein subunit n=1 Tax=Psychroserpens burtonensis TaxID=49278 RepID=A0A5C7BIF4_9FLAO|nr:acetyl-CoA carboxylase biotin carboxyl carrier protein subunit [Psychroserpens burtonensis]TXE19629.1 acetyl-CoA carboxylase biotin carboxyl carrier protein subunit [Psychroserpens burtonensis]
MSQSFKVNVNSSLNFDISETESSQLNSIKVSDNVYHVLYDNTSFKAEISTSNFNKKLIQVKINNTTYNIHVFNELDSLIKEMGFEVGSSKVINDIKAPMPGLILEISVQAGQHIKENDTLLILEAMKMENVLTSPREGIIKSISVEKGDAVDKNQLLIEFET